ncbi:MAG: hypothetical protein HYS07_04045 [Chlamydiae bacterium]|nr:hypothetical protein [Chlamydiota bacterium]MBI3277208.1 hypothetical protein [Chlamydiota bacterium]
MRTPYINIQITLSQIEAAIETLNPKQKIELVEKLEKSTWPDRLKALLQRIDRKISNTPISDEEIDKACHEVRHRPHGHSRHRY